MTLVIASEDCGNSPKNHLLQNLTIALARRDIDHTLTVVAEDIEWEVIGEKLIQGRSSLAKKLDELRNDPVSELEIFHVVSHGKAGAVDGATRMSNGTNYRFCHVYEFPAAKGTVVRRILSYVLPV